MQFKNFSIKYNEIIIPKFILMFNCLNKYLIPIIKKITVNCNFGVLGMNTTYLNNRRQDLITLCGQYPIVTKIKNSISEFKIKKGNSIGLLVTLRAEKMYAFLEKVILFVLPKIRAFNGLSTFSFDSKGSYTFGFVDQTLFPENQETLAETIYGFDISIQIKSSNLLNSFFLLNELYIPFKI